MGGVIFLSIWDFNSNLIPAPQNNFNPFYEMEWSKKFLGKILDFCLLFIKEKSENNNRTKFER